MFLNSIGLIALFCIVIGLFNLKGYQGRFSQKCVANFNSSSQNSYSNWIKDESIIKIMLLSLNKIVTKFCESR
jgi:hypothetical protein